MARNPSAILQDSGRTAMIGEPPVCVGCKHFHHTGPLACDAFPERIPDEILLHRNPHNAPFPGDHGIQFEPIEPPTKATTRPRAGRRTRRVH
jgi:hypothetical protein